MEQFRIYMTFQNLKDHHVSFLLTVFVAAKLSRPGSVTFIFILLQQHPLFLCQYFLETLVRPLTVLFNQFTVIVVFLCKTGYAVVCL